MQIFVDKTTLTGAGDEVVTVFGAYDDTATVASNAHGPNATVLTLPIDAIVTTQPPMTLVQDWRTTYNAQVLNGEANKRIVAVFPEYSQRNSNAELNNYITTYGANAGAWPAAQQSRKAEIDRCWQYVNDVRTKANAMAEAALPVDPTADANWPTVIAPYVPLS
jgi:hypothetical protein